MTDEELDLDDPLSSYVDVWKRVVLEPRAFFDALPHEGGLLRPLAFAVITLFVGGIGVVLTGGGLGGFFFLLIAGPVRLFFVAALVAVVARGLFEGRGDYEATFRALAYSSAIFVFVGFPVVKFFAALYGIALAILGIAAAHSFDTVRATLTLVAGMIAAAVFAWALGFLGWAMRTNPLFW